MKHKLIERIRDFFISCIKETVDEKFEAIFSRLDDLEYMCNEVEATLKSQRQETQAHLDRLQEEVLNAHVTATEHQQTREQDVQNCLNHLQEKVEHVLAGQAVGDDLRKGLITKVANLKEICEASADHYHAREQDVQNCLNHLQEKVEHVLAGQAVGDDLRKGFITKVANLKEICEASADHYHTREQDVQNCLDFIQEKVEYVIQRQFTAQKALDSVASGIQNMGISKEDLQDLSYYHYIKELHNLTRPVKLLDSGDMVRIGRENDGGYVMVEPFSSENVAYSFGICDDVSWDRDMVKCGYRIYQYDHTIDTLPEENPAFYWKKLGISSVDHDDLKTLETFMDENGHAGLHGLVLKMDVEGSEWEVLNSCPLHVLSQFDQIVMELHDLVTYQDKDAILSALRRLNETHVAIHVHGNNFGNVSFCGEYVTPNLLEVTYINRKKYHFIETADNKYPLKIDQPNCASKEDILIGKW